MTKNIRVLLCLLLLLLSSCSAKYGAYLGGYKTDYNEEAEYSGLFTGTESIPDINLSGKGFHVGIYEETDWVLTRIGFFSSSYDDINYSYAGDSYKLSLKDQGLEISLGPKLKWFYPHLIYLKHKSEFKINGERGEDDDASLGYGVELRFPVGDKFKVHGGYRYTGKTGLTAIGPGVVSADISHSSIYLGVSYELFSVEGMK